MHIIFLAGLRVKQEVLVNDDFMPSQVKFTRGQASSTGQNTDAQLINSMVERESPYHGSTDTENSIFFNVNHLVIVKHFSNDDFDRGFMSRKSEDAMLRL